MSYCENGTPLYPPEGAHGQMLKKNDQLQSDSDLFSVDHGQRVKHDKHYIRLESPLSTLNWETTLLLYMINKKIKTNYTVVYGWSVS